MQCGTSVEVFQKTTNGTTAQPGLPRSSGWQRPLHAHAHARAHLQHVHDATALPRSHGQTGLTPLRAGRTRTDPEGDVMGRLSQTEKDEHCVTLT